MQVIARGMLNANLNLVEHPEYVSSLLSLFLPLSLSLCLLLSLLLSLVLSVCGLFSLCASCSYGMALTLTGR